MTSASIVSLPSEEGLRPGMSAEIEILVAKHDDVLLIPVAAIVDYDDRSYCWVQIASKPVRKQIQIGDSNGIFSIVKKGLAEGDIVLLNPSAHEQPLAETNDDQKPEDPVSD